MGFRRSYIYSIIQCLSLNVHFSGLALGSGTPIVVSLGGALQCHVYNKIVEEGLKVDELDASVAKRLFGSE